MAYLWKNVLIESSSIFVGNTTASHGIFSGSVTAQQFFGTASVSISSSHAIIADTASYVDGSVISGSVASSSYSDFSLTSSYVSGTIVVPGNDREVLFNDNGQVGTAANFTYTSESVLTLNVVIPEPSQVTGGMYMDSYHSRLRICVDSATLYYDVL